MRSNRQARLDRLAFNTYVECNCSATEAARQLGIAPSTVRGRVRRESLDRRARLRAWQPS